MAGKSTRFWDGAVIYQIYPRSFLDTNGDGIGDLPGITAKLDYLASLGVDYVWICPFYPSPMADYGYDVADYTGVDPMFGTLDDFDRLVAEAHDRGLKIVIDQVLSHTSDQHPWFTESRSSRDNPKADYYVWADPKADGSPPSNWQSVFGGPAWRWDGQRKQYYFHNFLTEQPDLNLHNPVVQDALLEGIRFWLDRGVDGFRFDAINFAMHDPALTDNPPSGKPMTDVTRPFDMQEKKFSMSHKDIPAFLHRIRTLLDEYGDRFTVAEVVGEDATAEMMAFTRGEDHLHTAYNFDFLYLPQISDRAVRKALSPWLDRQDGGPASWAFENHDAPRAVTRWAAAEDREAAARGLLLLLLSLPGAVFLYQGEELGLPQGHVAFEDLKDPEAIANWPHTLGRDGARVPFPWRKDAPHGGFTTGTPWLPADPAQQVLAVDRQDGDPASTLALCRSLVKLRQKITPLREGETQMLDAPAGVFAMRRRAGDETILACLNLGPSPVRFRPEGGWTPLVHSGLGDCLDALPETLAPWEGYWARAVR